MVSLSWNVPYVKTSLQLYYAFQIVYRLVLEPNNTSFSQLVDFTNGGLINISELSPYNWYEFQIVTLRMQNNITELDSFSNWTAYFIRKEMFLNILNN